MQTSVVSKPAERVKNDIKDQVIINNLADSEAIVNVKRAVDGNYLCLTDKKGVTLRISLDQNCATFLDNNFDMMLAKTTLYDAFAHCADCPCEYREFAGERMCRNPITGQICLC